MKDDTDAAIRYFRDTISSKQILSCVMGFKIKNLKFLIYLNQTTKSEGSGL